MHYRAILKSTPTLGREMKQSFRAVDRFASWRKKRIYSVISEYVLGMVFEETVDSFASKWSWNGERREYIQCNYRVCFR